MRVLLDTVTFLWAADSPERLSRAAMSVLANVATMREMSTISLSEIAIKETRGKLAFGKEELSQAIADLRLHILPYTEKHAQSLFDLPLHHTDPFDRQSLRRR